MSTQPVAKEDYPVEQPDWFLQTLVSMVNTAPVDFGITLQVGGFLVSGNLISGAKYFEAFGSEFSTGLKDPEVAETYRKMFAEGAKIYEPDVNKTEEDLPLSTFIHLKDTRFFNGSGAPIPGNRGVWWRGRISEVSGFVLGTLGR